VNSRRKIATLDDGWREQGSYSVEFNAANLPSGVYLYRLQAGAHVAAKKMIVQK